MANTPLRFGGLRPKASAGHPPLNRSAVIELRNQCVACSRQLRINRHMWPKTAILPAEQRALWNLCCIFEKVSVLPLDVSYPHALGAARDRLRDEQ